MALLGAAGATLYHQGAPRASVPGTPQGSASLTSAPISTPLSTPAAAPTAPPAPNPDEVASRYANANPAAFGLSLPGIVKTLEPHALAPKTIALTFDACGGPHGSGVDEALLSTLIAENVPATLFFNQRWIDANLERAKQLASNPLFQIENHGTVHLPLSVRGQAAYGIKGTASAREVVAEIEGNRTHLRRILGVTSTWFRSGTAHYDDVSVKIATDLGQKIAGFDVNGDSGATQPAASVTQSLLGARAGTIALMHMNQPRSGTAQGVKAAIPQLRAAGYSFVTLG